MSAREAALQTLVAMDHQKAWSNGHLKKVIQEAHLDPTMVMPLGRVQRASSSP